LGKYDLDIQYENTVKIMVIYLKAGGVLKDLLKPDIDTYTRKVTTEAGTTIREILVELGINPSLVAYLYTDGKVQQLEYIPKEGQTITLQPPVSGG
jgi:sulfur carrier protein ThiS